MYIVLAELNFDEAWLSLQLIMWVYGSPYRVLDVLNRVDNDFYTISF